MGAGVSEPDHDKGGPTRHERLKARLLNNWVVAVLLIAGGVVVYVAGLADAVERLIDRLLPQPTLSVIATTTRSSDVCFLLPIRDGEEVAFQRSVINVTFDDLGGSGHVITVARLEPEWITGSVILGELEVKETYDVDLAPWLDFVLRAVANESSSTPDPSLAKRVKSEDGRTWVRPDPIDLVQLPGIFEVADGARERIQIRLGLPRAVEYVVGDVRLHLETNKGATFTSDPLPVTVCKVDPSATADYKAAQAAGGGN